VSVTQENLVISNITPDTIGTQFIEGAQNVPLIVFTSEGPGSASGSETLTMDSIRLKFLDPITDKEMDLERVVNLVESISVSNVQWFRDNVDPDLMKPTAEEPMRYATYQLSDSTTNPLTIQFENLNVFPANSLDTTVVMITFRTGASHQSFRLALENVYAYDVDPRSHLTAVDEELTPLSESNLLTTERVTLIPSDPEEAFITYPNPFGKNQEYANIRFYLESGGDVEIRMFTLIGELVWTKIVQGEVAGSHDGAIDPQYRWDGRNDRGYQVLNGVYLCVIRLKENNGETKTYTKKVAYIK
jgi:hypothetical protein